MSPDANVERHALVISNPSVETIPFVEVRGSAFGCGVFARQPIRRQALILHLTGALLSLDAIRAKREFASYGLQVGIDRYLDLQPPGCFINHSCAPNTGIFNDVEVRALRDIPAGDELFFDYSTTISDGWTMACRCGRPECRGVIAAFQLLPPLLQGRYRILGTVQRFIVRDVGA